MNLYMDSVVERFECQTNGLEVFSDVYEGVVIVKNKKNDLLDLELLGGQREKKFKVTREIASMIKRQDQMYVVMGKSMGTWWPIDLISIASAVELKDQKNMSQIHFSLNPLMVPPTDMDKSVARTQRKSRPVNH